MKNLVTAGGAALSFLLADGETQNTGGEQQQQQQNCRSERTVERHVESLREII